MTDYCKPLFTSHYSLFTQKKASSLSPRVTIWAIISRICYISPYKIMLIFGFVCILIIVQHNFIMRVLKERRQLEIA